MGHEAPERSPDVAPGRRPEVVETRPVSAPASELHTLDALAERAASAPVDATHSPALRHDSVQRLQLRAGNAAVAAMLQRRAAPQVRKPSPALQRKPATPASAASGAPGAPVQRSGTTARDGGPAPDLGETSAPPTNDTTDKTGAAAGGSSGLSFAAGTPAPPKPPAPPSLLQRRSNTPAVPTNGQALPLVQRRSMSSIIDEAKKRAAAPSGPEDTASVEGDIDMSDYTDAPDLARAERAANPPPPPPQKPPKPAILDAKLPPKPPPKPKGKKIGNAVVKGPKSKGAKGRPGAKSAPSPGEIVKKPAPPLPPVWKKPKPGVPVGKLPPPPMKAAPVKAKQDPAFKKVIIAAGMTVKKARKHPSGKHESANAQGAAVAPANDIDAQAKANRADTMATAKPKPFDEEAFVAAVKEAVAKTAPKSLSDAGNVGEKAEDAKAAIGEKVGKSKEAAAGDVVTKANQPPDPGTATPKPTTPMAPLEVEQPGGLKASSAMPAPVPNEQIDLREGPAKVDNEMAEAEVSEEQLAKSNEPEFKGALDAKKEGEEHSAQAPADVRKAEGAILKQATVVSAAEEKKTVGDANSTIGDTIGKVSGKKDETKSKDELKRKEVADHINSIFDKTKQDVDEILGGLDEKVDAEFTAGEAQIRQAFTQDWNNRLNRYKDDRYSGWRGPFRWGRDKLKGLPSAANKLYDVSKAMYTQQMDALVRRIAKTVSAELTRATVRIEQGRGEVSTYVSGLKGDLAKFGQEAAADMADKFDNLDSSVKDKFDDLAGSLAKKYAESRDAVDAEIEAAKEANKGLIDKAIGAVKAVIRVIKQLKDMVLNILSKIADVIGRIISDPIGFLKNFVSAVKAGITRFMDRIGEHLEKGLMGWLFGTLDAKGIEIPDSFSLQGILKLVMSVLGMTWTFVRERMVKKIGEPAMAALEAGADIVKKVIAGGPAVLWEMLLEKFSEFESMVVGEIKNFVMEKVVKAGITWLISLLNPAAAFIKACTMIYQIVMFFVERGSQIKEFIETLVDAAGDIARGGTGGVAEKIESVLAKLLPLAISFLASILGLGGVGDKVRSIIDKVRSPIKKAMDKVVDVVVKLTAPIWKPAKALFEKGKKLYGKAKEKVVNAYEKGKAKVKEKATAAKDWAKDKAGKVKKKVTDTATAAKDKVLAFLGLPIKKSVSMSGEDHEIRVEHGTGHNVVVMASAPMAVGQKIRAAAAGLRGKQQATPDPGTEQQLKDLKVLDRLALTVEREANDPKGSETKVQAAIAALVAAVAKYGRDHNTTDIEAVPSDPVDLLADLEKRAAADAASKEKLAQVRSETAAGAASLKEPFLREVALRARAASQPVWACMKAVVGAGGAKYSGLGDRITATVIPSGGMARVLDLRTAHRNDVISAAHKAAHGVDFTTWMRSMRRSFQLAGGAPDLDLTKPLQRNATVRGWWFVARQAPAVTVYELSQQLAIQESWSGYRNGALKFSVDGATATAKDIRKPTAFDAMWFGQWTPAPGKVFGVTGGGIEEALIAPLTGQDASKIDVLPPAKATTSAPPLLPPGGTPVPEP